MKLIAAVPSNLRHHDECQCELCIGATQQEHPDGCGCDACCEGHPHEHSGDSLHVHGSYDPTFGLPQLRAAQDFVTSGGRWTDGGGFTSSLGGSGGTIAWSIGAAGLVDTTGQFFSGSTVEMSTFLPFDFAATLQRAFDAWSEYGDISFVQVADQGGDIGAAGTPTIRVVGGYIDGQDGANTLARAFYPTSHPAGGDIVFDYGNTNFYANEHNFFLTALHEIGHAIGLGHEQTSNSIAIMNPTINTSLDGLQPDDIAGVQAVYGSAAAGSPDLIAGNVGVSNTSPTVGDTITVIYDITNSGDAAAADTTAGIYISTDATITTADTLLASELSQGSNAIGAVDSETVSLSLPILAEGTYFIGVIADINQNEPGESSESNNSSNAPVQITLNGFPDDYGADVGTNGNVFVGGSTTGKIDFDGDQDWFQVYLNAGSEYTVDLEGSPTGQGTVTDPFFRGVYDANGTLISGTSNDDGGIGLNSRLDFTPTNTGFHYLSAGAFDTAQGTYLLSVSDPSAIVGTAGDDNLVGNALDNAMTGLGGTDVLDGFGGDDTLDAGAGNGAWQYARGHGGNDVYIYAKEQGRLFIDPRSEGAADGTTDAVQFTDLNLADFSIAYLDYGGGIGNAVRMIWNDGNSSGELRIGQEAQYIEAFVFADGSVLTPDQIFGPVVGSAGDDMLVGNTLDNAMTGLSGTDVLDGFSGDDTLDAGAGNGAWQYARGHGGNDVYIYAKEQGRLFIDPRSEGAADGTADAVQFTDLNLADFTISFVDYGGAIGNALRMIWSDGSGSGELRIGQEGQFIETFSFADGSNLTIDDILGPVVGTAGDDVLSGDARDNAMTGLDGTDVLDGFGGNDTLDAGAGTGAWQYARGHGGNDIYVYAKEQGRLFIDPRSEGAADGTADMIQFTDLNQVDFTIDFFDYGNDIGNAVRLLWDDGGASGELRIGQEGQYIESFAFADGSVLTWNDWFSV